MTVQNFVASYEELLQFLHTYHDQLFYVAINVEQPPQGARSFNITTFPDEAAVRVIQQIHHDPNPPRITPEVQARIDAAAINQVQFGCGVNIDPMNPAGKPSPGRLQGTQWVRFPFYSPAHHWTMEAAFAFYDPIIRAYNNQGVNVALVLNHQTYGEGEGYVWPQMDSARWATFTNHFVAVAERVTQHYGNQVAAYEIWNEGDVPNNPSAVYIPAMDYAPLLRRTTDVIRRNAPRSKAILGGLVGGSAIIRRYLSDVQKALNAALPVDGIGLHPYGLGAPNDPTVFAQFGSIQPALTAIHQAAPNIPIWITEVGALGANQPQYWADAAKYMRGLVNYLRPHAVKVPVFIWYAWSDGMASEARTNGLVTVDQKPKSPIYETFFELARQ